MLRKTFILIITIPVLLLLTGIVVSCRSVQYDSYVCNVDVTDESYVKKDTLMVSDATTLLIYAIPQATCLNPASMFMSACYATKKCVTWKNNIDSTSLSLTLDRAITIGSNLIPSNTNLLRNQHFSQHANFKKEANECNGIFYKLAFNKSLMTQMATDDGVYVLTFTCRTTDNRQISKTLHVRFVK